MSHKVQPIPEGYNAITPYLIVNQGAKAIEFYKKAFGAIVEMCMEKPDGKIGHSELKIGDSKFMLADEHPEENAKGPESYGGSPISIHLYVKDVDTTFNRAVSAGAKAVRPLENMFYGDRCGTVKDPFGHTWYIATHVEDVSPEEIEKRVANLYNKK